MEKIAVPVRRRLPEERRAITHEFEVGGQNGYITVGLFDDGMPGEIFLTISKEGSTISAMMDILAISVSIHLQNGIPLENLVKKFTSIRFEPSGITRNKCIPSATSIIDYIFRWLGLKFLPLETLESLGITNCKDCGRVLFEGRYACVSHLNNK
ncbi:MAG: hypothetical protein EXS47_02700 [Candidatus Zambryskibacteria bacterium]|nr:hypothetical protein [Candidatus Zambryskibacteria bacterium]